MATVLTPLRLTGPDDYADWYARIHTRALEEDIWRYIDPDGVVTLEEPSYPNPRDFYRLENHQPPQEEDAEAAEAAEAVLIPPTRGGRRGRATRASQPAVILRIVNI